MPYRSVAVRKWFDEFPANADGKLIGLLSVDLILFDKIINLGIPLPDGFDEALAVIRLMALDISEGRGIDPSIHTTFVAQARRHTSLRWVRRESAVIRCFSFGIGCTSYTTLIYSKMQYMIDVCNLLDMGNLGENFREDEIFDRREGFDIFMNLFAQVMAPEATR